MKLITNYRFSNKNIYYEWNKLILRIIQQKINSQLILLQTNLTVKLHVHIYTNGKYCNYNFLFLSVYLLFHNIFDIFVKIYLTASELFKFLLILNEQKTHFSFKIAILSQAIKINNLHHKILIVWPIFYIFTFLAFISKTREKYRNFEIFEKLINICKCSPNWFMSIVSFKTWPNVIQT